MSLITVSIDEFPQDGAPWRIDGFGTLHSTGSSRSEPMIDVYLSQLLPEYEDPLKNGFLAGPSKRIPIKVGLIALLKPGSVWVNKVRCLPKVSPRWLECRISPEQVELHTWGTTIEFEGRTIPLIAPHQFFVPHDNWLGLVQSWVVLIRRPIPSVPYLVIPSSVVFQKCFTESPKAIRKLLRGELHRIIDKPSRVEMSDGTETYFVELAKEVDTPHAYAFANLAADPVGRRTYERLRRTLVAASVNENRAGIRGLQTYINLGFPFSNPLQVRVQGKSLPLRKTANDVSLEFAFLATEIVNLDVRLVFDRLIVHRKNSGDKGQNSEDPDLKDAWLRRPLSPLDLDEDALVPTTSDEDPLSDLDKLLAEEAGGFNALKLEVIKDPKLTQQYRNRMIAEGAKGAFDGSTTTGDTKSGNQGAAELDIETNEAPRVPVTLDSFIETLEILRNAGYRFETRVVTTMCRYNNGGDVVNFFPRYIKGSRSWHLVADHQNSPPRGYIVATHQSGGVWHHFIELERKEEKGRSLAHVRTNNGSLIEARQMRLFMIDVAHERGWNAISLRPHWTLTTINHSPKKGLLHFARAIAKVIGATIPQP